MVQDVENNKSSIEMGKNRLWRLFFKPSQISLTKPNTITYPKLHEYHYWNTIFLEKPYIVPKIGFQFCFKKKSVIWVLVHAIAGRRSKAIVDDCCG